MTDMTDIPNSPPVLKREDGIYRYNDPTAAYGVLNNKIAVLEQVVELLQKAVVNYNKILMNRVILIEDKINM